MPIFSLNQEKLERIKEVKFTLEKEIRGITEKNLKSIFNLQFVRTEFTLGNLRIDTLAYDNANKSFVIIEYKKDKNFSVIDQGYAYLALMLNNKSDFILEYNERCDKTLKRGDVDWSQSRVIFISPAFSKYQQKAIHFKDLPIELWEISKYDNKTILYNRLKSPETSESVSKISKKSDVVQKVSREVKVYSEDDHLQKSSEKTKELYEEIKERILTLDENIEIIPRKFYIGFVKESNFTDITIQKSKLKIFINMQKGQLNDPKGIARDISNIGHWGNGDYEISISNLEQIDYLMSLIKQSYEKHS